MVTISNTYFGNSNSYLFWLCGHVHIEVEGKVFLAAWIREVPSIVQSYLHACPTQQLLIIRNSNLFFCYVFKQSLCRYTYYIIPPKGGWLWGYVLLCVFFPSPSNSDGTNLEGDFNHCIGTKINCGSRFIYIYMQLIIHYFL